MAETFNSEYWSGQGPVFLARRDTDGSDLGFEFLGDMPQVEVTNNINRTTIQENVTGGRLTAVSFSGDREYQLNMTFNSAKAEHLAKILQADLTTKAAGSVTDEAVTAYHDKFVNLAHVKVSSVVVTNHAGAVTYVADTDYVVHADEGMLEILSTGSITDAQALLVDYDYAAQKHLKHNPTNYEYILLAPALNRARDNKRGKLIAHKVSIDPGNIQLIQDGDLISQAQVSGTLLADTTRSPGDQVYSFLLED